MVILLGLGVDNSGKTANFAKKRRYFMAASFSYWKGFIDKTLKDRKRRLPVNDMDNMVKGKGIIRTLIDDHRDAAMYRHAMRSLYCKIKGDYVGKTVKHEDESGCVQMLFREVDKLMKRNKELEAIIQERKR